MEEKNIKINEESRHEIDEQEKKNPNTKEGHLFTQEEVNEIIRKRLYERKNEQEKNKCTEEDYQRREQDLSERERTLSLRESRISCMEYLKKNNYPDELLEALDTSDFKAFKENAERISNAYNRMKKNFRTAPLAAPETPVSDNNECFPNSKHVPKYAEIRNW